MKLLPQRSASSIWLAASLAGLLIVLATLQYRWIGQVSEAERQRREINLQSAVRIFRQEFYTELLHVCLAFRLEPRFVASRDWQRLVGPYEDWKRYSARPELVSDLLIWEAGYQSTPRLLRVDPVTGTPAPAQWPAGLERLATKLAADAAARNQAGRGGLRASTWTLDEAVPALLHPLVQFSLATAPGEPNIAHVVGYEVVVLNAKYLETRLLPELVDRHFRRGGASDCMVEIVDRTNPSQAIYRSDPAQPPLAVSGADLSESIMGEPLEDFIWLAASRENVQRSPQTPAPAGVFIFPEYGNGRWQLLAKFRAGPLGAQVNALRIRNLGVSFGVLLLLAVSVALVVAYAHRVQRLARLQMEFVAGVSHELRTPLAVIASAADNLAEGVVKPESSVKRYGETIRGETRRLRSMVEQILLFAADKTGRRFELGPVDVAVAIRDTLAAESAIVERAAVTVETDIEDAAPPAEANETGLKQCLGNLIRNAVQYGGEGRWLGIMVRVVRDGPAAEIRITVKDRAAGMDDSELQQVFQPFYRGRAARETLTHGTGLGLSLVKDAIEAMNGRITAQSAPGRGSAFTLHLRIAQDMKS